MLQHNFIISLTRPWTNTTSTQDLIETDVGSGTSIILVQYGPQELVLRYRPHSSLKTRMKAAVMILVSIFT
jgi:hypothetical protein